MGVGNIWEDGDCSVDIEMSMGYLGDVRHWDIMEGLYVDRHGSSRKLWLGETFCIGRRYMIELDKIYCRVVFTEKFFRFIFICSGVLLAGKRYIIGENRHC